jgi:hypothetical protein
VFSTLDPVGIVSFTQVVELDTDSERMIPEPSELKPAA